MKDTTTIQINLSTKELVDMYRYGDESNNSVIIRLIKLYEYMITYHADEYFRLLTLFEGDINDKS